MRARFVSFDCYGTLINFQMDHAIAETFGDRLPEEERDAFLATCEAYRFDEVLGDYQPYREVIASATRRAAVRYGVEYREKDGNALYEAVATWGPHPGVEDALAELASHHELVILSNAADEQIGRNVERLGAPFHAVLTAEQARVYKPRLAAFEYMFAQLGCEPVEIVHVSSSPMYDLRPAQDLGIGWRVLLNRGYEPSQPWLGYSEIADIADLPALVEDAAGVLSGR
jgi:2-haloacid dehalogenase